MTTLPDDYWHHDEREQTLTGRRSRVVYRLAQTVSVLLREANPVTGGMVFHIVPASEAAQAQSRSVGGPPARKGMRPRLQ